MTLSPYQISLRALYPLSQKAIVDAELQEIRELIPYKDTIETRTAKNVVIRQRLPEISNIAVGVLAAEHMLSRKEFEKRVQNNLLGFQDMAIILFETWTSDPRENKRNWVKIDYLANRADQQTVQTMVDLAIMFDGSEASNRWQLTARCLIKHKDQAEILAVIDTKAPRYADLLRHQLKSLSKLTQPVAADCAM